VNSGDADARVAGRADKAVAAVNHGLNKLAVVYLFCLLSVAIPYNIKLKCIIVAETYRHSFTPSMLLAFTNIEHTISNTLGYSTFGMSLSPATTP